MHTHLFCFVSQDLAEQAMKDLRSLDYVKAVRFLNLPLAWTVEFKTEVKLDLTLQHALVEQVKPMILSFNTSPSS